MFLIHTTPNSFTFYNPIMLYLRCLLMLNVWWISLKPLIDIISSDWNQSGVKQFLGTPSGIFDIPLGKLVWPPETTL